MFPIRRRSFSSALIAALLVIAHHALAADCFVNKHGTDTNNGTTRDAALATIQKGVAALQPGDTLTIRPGEYHESVKRSDLGSADKDTIIRAEIAGTVVPRGDVPAPEFRPVAGHRFVYAVDFDFKGDVPVVNEMSGPVQNRNGDGTKAEWMKTGAHQRGTPASEEAGA